MVDPLHHQLLALYVKGELRSGFQAEPLPHRLRYGDLAAG
jgi:hypothetical protein